MASDRTVGRVFRIGRRMGSLAGDRWTMVQEGLRWNAMQEFIMIGNSVCPDEAEALVGANAADIIELYQRLAA